MGMASGVAKITKIGAKGLSGFLKKGTTLEKGAMTSIKDLGVKGTAQSWMKDSSFAQKAVAGATVVVGTPVVAKGAEVATGVAGFTAGAADAAGKAVNAAGGINQVFDDTASAFEGYGALPAMAVSGILAGTHNPVAKIAGIGGLAVSALKFYQDASQHEGGIGGYLQDFSERMGGLFSGNIEKVKEAQAQEQPVSGGPEIVNGIEVAQVEAPEVNTVQEAVSEMEF